MPRATLTRKQELFCQKYVGLKGNGTQAAMFAYDTKDERVANAISVENLSKPLIQKRLAELTHAEDAPAKPRRERIVARLEEIAFTQPDGFKGSDSVKALELLGKFENGMWIDRSEANVQGDVNVYHGIPRPKANDEQT